MCEIKERNRGHRFEREQEDVYEKFWRDKGECGNYGIILYCQNIKNIKKRKTEGWIK